MPRPRRLVAPLLAAALAAVALPATALPAGAAVPVPQVRSFGPEIDPYAKYTTETGCDPTAKAGPKAVVALIERTYGPQNTNIPRPCSASASGHEEGRSIDWMLDVRTKSQRQRANAFLGWLQATDEHGNAHAMVRRLGIMYVIWNGRMWRAYDPDRGGGSGWTEYSKCRTTMTSKAYDNTCHRNHIHLSFSWEGAEARTSYYGSSAPATCATVPTSSPAPPLGTSRRGFVPVSQRRVLNTATGFGAGGDSCRAAAGARVNVPVTGRGGVPASGVSAVALAVTVKGGTRETTVSTYPARRRGSATATVSAPAGARRTAVRVVPVGADGNVSFEVSDGSAHVSADVLGYHPDTGGSRYRVAKPAQVADVTVPARGRKTVRVGGKAGMPGAGFAGAVLSATTVKPAGSGGLAAWSAAPGARRPGAPAATVTRGRTTTSRLVVPTTANGRLVLENRTGKPLRTKLHAVGRYGSTGTRFRALATTPVVDTRDGTGVTGAMTAGRTARVDVTGGEVPDAAKAVVLQVSALDPGRDTRVAVGGVGTAFRTAPAMNPRRGESDSHLVVAPVGTGGKVAFFNRDGRTHLVADLVGYYR